MNQILEGLIFIVSGIIISVLFTVIKNRVTKSATAVVKEKFSGKKLVDGAFNILSPVAWSKDIVSIFNVRKLTIYTIILGVIFAFGYYQGIMGKPVQFDLRGKTAKIRLNEHYLGIEKNGTAKVLDKDGNVIKTITAKDIPELVKLNRPYGIEPRLIGVGGLGVGSTINGEAGLGISLLKYQDYRAGLFGTNKGGYLGVSYKLEKHVKWLHNTSAILGYGREWGEDKNRAFGGLSWEW